MNDKILKILKILPVNYARQILKNHGFIHEKHNFQKIFPIVLSNLFCHKKEIV